MKKVKEIFLSIQGEGANTGMVAVFVRFSGCNLHCPFCDEHHDTGVMMSDDEIIATIKKNNCRNVVLTGGEPTLQIDNQFVEKLHCYGFYVTIETNGTRPVPSNVDYVTCSPKESYVGAQGRLAINACDELKLIYSGGDLDVSSYDSINTTRRYVQPCATGDTAKDKEIMDDLMTWLFKHPEWRLSVQMHKLIRIK